MTTEPTGFRVGPQLLPRLALVLPDPLDRIAWHETHAEVVGNDFVEYYPIEPSEPPE